MQPVFDCANKTSIKKPLHRATAFSFRIELGSYSIEATDMTGACAPLRAR
jgi:hypothetical protein